MDSDFLFVIHMTNSVRVWMQLRLYQHVNQFSVVGLQVFMFSDGKINGICTVFSVVTPDLTVTRII